jgi:hypothetical protein
MVLLNNTNRRDRGSDHASASSLVGTHTAEGKIQIKTEEISGEKRL